MSTTGVVFTVVVVVVVVERTVVLTTSRILGTVTLAPILVTAFGLEKRFTRILIKRFNMTR